MQATVYNKTLLLVLWETGNIEILWKPKLFSSEIATKRVVKKEY